MKLKNAFASPLIVLACLAAFSGALFAQEVDNWADRYGSKMTPRLEQALERLPEGGTLDVYAVMRDRPSSAELMNLVRGVSSEGFGRLNHFRRLRRRLDADTDVRAFFERETAVIPAFYTDMVRKELGNLWRWLPAGALEHDPQAYLKASRLGTPAAASSVAEAVPGPDAAEAGS